LYCCHCTEIYPDTAVSGRAGDGFLPANHNIYIKIYVWVPEEKEGFYKKSKVSSCAPRYFYTEGCAWLPALLFYGTLLHICLRSICPACFLPERFNAGLIGPDFLHTKTPLYV